MQQRVDARIGKAQARGPLAAGRDRAVDALKGIFRQDAIMTDMLDIEQAAVGRKTDFAQLPITGAFSFERLSRGGINSNLTSML
jgi:hypothetical protein